MEPGISAWGLSADAISREGGQGSKLETKLSSLDYTEVEVKILCAITETQVYTTF